MNSLSLAVSDQIGGELPVKTECLPFSQIPHTTRLFSDFLSYSPAVRRFYRRSPYFSEWLKQETPSIRYENSRCERVAEILQRQNQERDRKSTRLNSSHVAISYAVFCLK